MRLDTSTMGLICVLYEWDFTYTQFTVIAKKIRFDLVVGRVAAENQVGLYFSAGSFSDHENTIETYCKLQSGLGLCEEE